MQDTSIQHFPDQNRFIWTIQGQEAILDYEKISDSVYAYTHVFVPPSLRGKNIAAQLTRFALDEAGRLGWKVKAVCPYIKSYVKRHADALSEVLV